MVPYWIIFGADGRAAEHRTTEELFCDVRSRLLLKERRPAGHEAGLSGEPQQSHQDEENPRHHLGVAAMQPQKGMSPTVATVVGIAATSGCDLRQVGCSC